MYIRAKQIKGHTYYYLVEGRRAGGRVRQRVVRYLGKRLPLIEAGISRYRNPQETPAMHKLLQSTGGRRVARIHAHLLAEDLRRVRFPSHVLPAEGGYLGAYEPSIFVSVQTHDLKTLLGTLARFARQTNQESVLVSLRVSRKTQTTRPNLTYAFDQELGTTELVRLMEQIHRASDGKIGGWTATIEGHKTVLTIKNTEYDGLSPHEWHHYLPTIVATLRQHNGELQSYSTHNIILTRKDYEAYIREIPKAQKRRLFYGYP